MADELSMIFAILQMMSSALRIFTSSFNAEQNNGAGLSSLKGDGGSLVNSLDLGSFIGAGPSSLFFAAAPCLYCRGDEDPPPNESCLATNDNCGDSKLDRCRISPGDLLDGNVPR